jgi:hypothetical protein
VWRSFVLENKEGGVKLKGFPGSHKIFELEWGEQADE